jgi:antitoxin HicB
VTTEEAQRLTNEELRIDEYPFTIRVLSSDEGGGYLVEYPDVPGCMSDGETREEAIQNGKDALRCVLLTMIEVGDPIPRPLGAKPAS